MVGYEGLSIFGDCDPYSLFSCFGNAHLAENKEGAHPPLIFRFSLWGEEAEGGGTRMGAG